MHSIPHNAHFGIAQEVNIGDKQMIDAPMFKMSSQLFAIYKTAFTFTLFTNVICNAFN